MAITQDQYMGIVRQVVPFVAGALVGHGYLSSADAADLSTLLIQIAGPAFGLGGLGWALVVNSRKNIMLAASKPAAPGLPPPQIILPAAEKALADALPQNVTTATSGPAPVPNPNPNGQQAKKPNG